jgi:16S rRNA (cytidine1402-2'-O)-methyltransferase
VGFPPHKKGRKTFIENIGAEKRTVVLYESPYRVVKFLEEFKEYVNAERQISISREISKKFEETIRGNADELIEHFKKKEPKGEFVIVVSNV